jgi:hypothetical protein
MIPMTTNSSTSVKARLRITNAFLNPLFRKANLMKDLRIGPTFSG